MSELDQQINQHMQNSEKKTNDTGESDLGDENDSLDSKISQQLLRKYIYYARNLHPTLDHPSVSQKLINVFSELRNQTNRRFFLSLLFSFFSFFIFYFVFLYTFNN